MKFIFKCFNHDENTSSLITDVTKDKYYCLSCGIEGVISDTALVSKMVIDHLRNIADGLEKIYKINI